MATPSLDFSISIPIQAGNAADKQYKLVVSLDQDSTNWMAIGWGKLPNEIKDRIIQFAMATETGEIRMPCLTARAFKPNIAVSALRVNKYFYQEGSRHLYRQNKLIIDHFGSDLRQMNQIWRDCRSQSPIFQEIVLKFGDNESSITGELKASSFAHILRRLAIPLRTRLLIIVLQRYHFRDTNQFKAFTLTLANITASSRFALSCDDMLVDFAISHLTTALHMNREPLFAAHDPCSPGKLGGYSGIFGRSREAGEREVQLDEVANQPWPCGRLIMMNEDGVWTWVR